MSSEAMTDEAGPEATLTAELLAEAIRNAQGNTGVLVRDPPPPGCCSAQPVAGTA